MSRKYKLPDSVMNSVRQLLIVNKLSESEIETALRLYSDGFEGNFVEFLRVVKYLN